MNIGEAADASGVTARMIRYYESVGLISETARSDGGYRKYGQRDVHVLRFVKRARALGFPVEQIRALLSLWQDGQRASKDVKEIALRHVEGLTKRIDELTEMRDTVLKRAEHCAGDDRPDCPILLGLASSNETTVRQCPHQYAGQPSGRRTVAKPSK